MDIYKIRRYSHKVEQNTFQFSTLNAIEVGGGTF